MQRLYAYLLTCAFAASLCAQSAGSFTPTGNMAIARARHTATLLQNGKVLVAGGWVVAPTGLWVAQASAELYDPATGTFSTTGNMTAARLDHTATLLPNGNVLIVGGSSENGFLVSAEIYDPATGTFSRTGFLAYYEYALAATPLRDGKVLVNRNLYDPDAGTFTVADSEAGHWVCPYPLPDSTLLPDGTVFQPLFGRRYDAARRRFVLLQNAGCFSTATLLPTGKVLRTGGWMDLGPSPLWPLDDDWAPTADANIYDPVADASLPAQAMADVRTNHTATLLPDGSVLVAGGSNITTNLARAEVYDATTAAFRSAGNMTSARASHTATLLNDGTVLIAGGLMGGSLASAELFRPTIPTPAPALLTGPSNAGVQGAVLHSGTSQIVSNSDPAAGGDYLEIYCTGLLDGSVIPPHITIGGRPAEVLYFGATPGYPGLYQVNVRMPLGVLAGSAVPVRINYLGRFSNEVTIGAW